MGEQTGTVSEQNNASAAFSNQHQQSVGRGAYEQDLGRVLDINDIGQQIIRIRPTITNYASCDGGQHYSWNWVPLEASSVLSTAAQLFHITAEGSLNIFKGGLCFTEENDGGWTTVSAFCNHYGINFHIN